MRLMWQLEAITLLFLLVACQGREAAGSLSPPEEASGLTEATQPHLETPTSEPAPSPQAEASKTPPPTLLGIAWDDRRPFEPGLIDSERSGLQGLAGATVYHIKAQLDPSLTEVQGQQEVYYTNREMIPLGEIYFHLYPNLLGGELAVSSLRVAGESVTPRYEFERSIMLVPLMAPLQPGESVAVQIEFHTRVPVESGRNYGVFAMIDDILALADFYPMVAVYDADMWHIEPATQEGDVVFADSSFYLVRVSAAADTVIVTSGIEIERRDSAEGQTVTYAAGPMRDFYVAASERFQRVSRRVGQTEISSYAPAEMAEGAGAALDTAAVAVSSFTDRFGSYPFTELDIVSTPTLALGVEYPGIFANAIRMYDLAETTAGLPNPTILESVTAHETGHQWFYSVIGNDQLEEPWLDEALTQYATWQYYIDRYGQASAAGFYQSLVNRWARIESADIPIGLPVAAYEGVAYSAIVYGRGPLFLNKLAETVGQERFDAFLREYYSTYKWEIATTEGFKRLLEEECDCDLSTLFEEWVYAK